MPERPALVLFLCILNALKQEVNVALHLILIKKALVLSPWVTT